MRFRPNPALALMRSSPLGSVFAALTASAICSASSRIRWAQRSTVAPSSFRLTRRVVRCSSRTFSASSSMAIRLLT